MAPFLSRTDRAPLDARYLAMEESGAKTDIVVRVRSPIVQVQVRQAIVVPVVPVAPTDRKTPHFAVISLIRDGFKPSAEHFSNFSHLAAENLIFL